MELSDFLQKRGMRKNLAENVYSTGPPGSLSWFAAYSREYNPALYWPQRLNINSDTKHSRAHRLSIHNDTRREQTARHRNDLHAPLEHVHEIHVHAPCSPSCTRVRRAGSGGFSSDHDTMASSSDLEGCIGEDQKDVPHGRLFRAEEFGFGGVGATAAA
ncbi:hypothetical protein BOTBODRAFT_187719 [Botryobasidium botryosum FD-172 SS1]|uniref:Uncharacterized protein n=1 Tax=Botryobasidium botryosum (strain FD-172 SS1) TaxID=930990 RepID=A0A067MGM9_BOTB1|nr:hypothetical protein BOTBODRAFT_187719 [Botryobasidium botryosum FD-172 SS1]